MRAGAPADRRPCDAEDAWSLRLLPPECPLFARKFPANTSAQVRRWQLSRRTFKSAWIQQPWSYHVPDLNLAGHRGCVVAAPAAPKGLPYAREFPAKSRFLRACRALVCMKYWLDEGKKHM